MDRDGKEVLYKYDKVDKTLQRYSDDVPERTNEKSSSMILAYGIYIIVGLGILAIVVAIVAIIFLRGKEKRKIKEKYIQSSSNYGE